MRIQLPVEKTVTKITHKITKLKAIKSRRDGASVYVAWGII